MPTTNPMLYNASTRWGLFPYAVECGNLRPGGVRSLGESSCPAPLLPFFIPLYSRPFSQLCKEQDILEASAHNQPD